MNLTLTITSRSAYLQEVQADKGRGVAKAALSARIWSLCAVANEVAIKRGPGFIPGDVPVTFTPPEYILLSTLRRSFSGILFSLISFFLLLLNNCSSVHCPVIWKHYQAGESSNYSIPHAEQIPKSHGNRDFVESSAITCLPSLWSSRLETRLGLLH